MGNFKSVTQSAIRQSRYLVEEGYLHNDYERFKTIKSQKVGFDELIPIEKINSLVDKIIALQARRESGVLKQLGVVSLKQLNQRYFTDNGINELITEDLNQFYELILNGALDGITSNNSDNGQKITGEQIKQGLDKAMKEKMKKASIDYQKTYDKIITNSSIGNQSFTGVNSGALQALNSLQDKTELNQEELYDLSNHYFASWKHEAMREALGSLLAQFEKVKGVKITNNNYDNYGKKSKSEFTVQLENGKDFGFSLANRKSNNGRLAFTLQSGGVNGTSFSSFIDRLKDLKSISGHRMVNTSLSEIIDGVTTKNFYYNLVNEALHRTTFKKSEPVIEFLGIIKKLSAAWFGTQIVSDTEAQNVDFFFVEGVGLIPMSKLLKLIKVEGNKIYVGMNSTAEIDEYSYYERKIEAGNAAKRSYAYGPEVRAVGKEMGEKVYSGITIGEIKLNLLLSQVATVTAYR